MLDLLDLSYVADRYRAYPGDLVTLSFRVIVSQPVAALTVEMTLAAEMELVNFVRHTQPPTPVNSQTTLQQAAHQLIWYEQRPALLTDYEVTVKISHEVYLLLEKVEEPQGWDRHPRKPEYIPLQSEATVRTRKTASLCSKKVLLHVYGRANYLQYLPALYEQDRLLNQMLIFFESYWRPIQQQLDQLAHYFDPMLTPAPLLPWLASWFDWAFVEDWPLAPTEREQWRRKLLHYAVSVDTPSPTNAPNFHSVLHLHRTRGTAEGLKRYLELYLGLEKEGKVIIQSYTLHSLRLGATAQLGRGIALYQQEREPHTFDVTITMPAAFGLDQQRTSLPLAQIEARKQALTERIRNIIQAEKPAHTFLKSLTIAIAPLSAAGDDAAINATANKG